RDLRLDHDRPQPHRLGFRRRALAGRAGHAQRDEVRHQGPGENRPNMNETRVAPAANASTDGAPVAGMRILLLGYTRFALRQKAMFQARGARATYVKRHFGLRALPLVPMSDVVYQM